MPDLASLEPTLLGLTVLVIVTIALLWGSRTPHRFAPALAIMRGAAQLAAISVILHGVIASPVWVAVALLVMFIVATVTATRRIRWSWQKYSLIAGAMAAGVLLSLTVVFSTGAIEFTPRYLLALGGIVIGNAMTVATLSGRRINEAVIEHWGEVEAWLALGGTPRQATSHYAQLAVYTALIPSTDQTKTTGLVTLPGAFVGAIFGGVSPFEAGRFQIVVLACIMATGALTAVIIVHALAPAKERPEALR